MCRHPCLTSFFFNDTATPEIYTLSLHDALPICRGSSGHSRSRAAQAQSAPMRHSALSLALTLDRKSTRLNSSHITISYAVFCLKKKKKNTTHKTYTQKQHKNDDKHLTRYQY